MLDWTRKCLCCEWLGEVFNAYILEVHTMSIFEHLIMCWNGWKNTLITFGWLSIVEQQLCNPLWCSICSPRLLLCIKTWSHSCVHLKGSFLSVKKKAKEHRETERERRKKRKSKESKSQFSASLLSSYQLFFPALVVMLQFRHQAHVSRTDLIYRGTSLLQPTRLCPPTATPLSEPPFWVQPHPC